MHCFPCSGNIPSVGSGIGSVLKRPSRRHRHSKGVGSQFLKNGGVTPLRPKRYQIVVQKEKVPDKAEHKQDKCHCKTVKWA